ncbi:MAG: head GIN domain-containing protein [Bacteroidota bacterium]
MKSLAFLLSIAAFGSCNVIDCTTGSGNIITKTFPQESFDSFDLSSSADVELIPSDRNSIEISTYENLFEKVQVENKSGEVSVDMKGCTRMDQNMKVKVFFTQLSAVKLSGSGDITAKDTIRGNRFSISILGSGDVNVLASVNILEADILGSGDVTLAGTTAEFRGKINGSGDIRSTGLTSGTTDIAINGSGDATLGSCTNLTSKVNGSGNVNCKGTK